MIGGNISSPNAVQNATVNGFELGGGRSSNTDMYWIAIGN